MLVDYHANTNYSVVDLELIQELYRRSYQEQVRGCQRLRWINVSRVTDVHETGDDVVAVIRSLADGETVDAARRRDRLRDRLRPRRARARCSASSMPSACMTPTASCSLRRDYRVETAPAVTGGIYVQGASQHLHGLSSSLLSNTAVRAGEILQSLLAERPATAARRPDLAVASHV